MSNKLFLTLCLVLFSHHCTPAHQMMQPATTPPQPPFVVVSAHRQTSFFRDSTTETTGNREDHLVVEALAQQTTWKNCWHWLCCNCCCSLCNNEQAPLPESVPNPVSPPVQQPINLAIPRLPSNNWSLATNASSHLSLHSHVSSQPSSSVPSLRIANSSNTPPLPLQNTTSAPTFRVAGNPPPLSLQNAASAPLPGTDRELFTVNDTTAKNLGRHTKAHSLLFTKEVLNNEDFQTWQDQLVTRYGTIIPLPSKTNT